MVWACTGNAQYCDLSQFFERNSTSLRVTVKLFKIIFEFLDFELLGNAFSNKKSQELRSRANLVCKSFHCVRLNLLASLESGVLTASQPQATHRHWQDLATKLASNSILAPSAISPASRIREHAFPLGSPRRPPANPPLPLRRPLPSAPVTSQHAPAPRPCPGALSVAMRAHARRRQSEITSSSKRLRHALLPRRSAPAVSGLRRANATRGFG